MRTKLILGSLLTLATVLGLVATVAAFEVEGTLVDPDSVLVKVDGTYVDIESQGSVVSVVAGDEISVSLRFTSLVYDQDVTVEAELDGNKIDVDAETSAFDVEPTSRYSKAVTLQIPNKLDDEDLSDELELTITVDGDDHKSEIGPIVLKLQKPSFSASIKSITTSQSVQAGSELPVDFVIKNIGYNDLEDLYVIASIEALGVQKAGYFGDIVALECDEDDTDEFPWSSDTLDRSCDEDEEDSVNGNLKLEIPQDAKAGIYTVEVKVGNEDTVSAKTVQVVVKNEFESTVFKSGNSLWLVNPTDNVMGYRLIAESPATVSEGIVFVPAGASQTVVVNPNAEGDYSFDVKVFSVNGELLDTVTFSGKDANSGTNTPSTSQTKTNPVVILTVILAIIFVVLLVVLIVLIGKKPKDSGEFGESYY